jgi:hypothetical protein
MSSPRCVGSKRPRDEFVRGEYRFSIHINRMSRRCCGQSACGLSEFGPTAAGVRIEGQVRADGGAIASSPVTL